MGQSRIRHGMLGIGQVASRSGIAASALRYYESEGLIHSERSQGGQRRFKRDVLRRLAVIRTAQRLGIPLQEIKAAFATLPAHRSPGKRDWQQLSRSWQKQLSVRIEQLTRLRDQLDGCIGCGCLSLQSCPLRNPQDIAAKAGPGARLFEEVEE
ncbi:redox-sensitive transcriptional activator SoxR [Wenzhouxiangella sp. AB-CW3]|uniref:redox-sensitive transcriptional activator SoxR n=1 Tax=Wenzhouxiangella sp. AB-CW3 TaxID=2771012 RepID=UPI00168B8A08|nr:redox-sensitive transcriptional activator SoxR [Wenzhouxiangella sp. AB-CW3]QOC24039.1 redox-sensitive transcriptional activator SoxR [Wenzhouxiangella sp. AB-CW3]